MASSALTVIYVTVTMAWEHWGLRMFRHSWLGLGAWMMEKQHGAFLDCDKIKSCRTLKATGSFQGTGTPGGCDCWLFAPLPQRSNLHSSSPARIQWAPSASPKGQKQCKILEIVYTNILLKQQFQQSSCDKLSSYIYKDGKFSTLLLQTFMLWYQQQIFLLLAVD